MPLQPTNLNIDVSRFLDDLDHPLREEIELLRKEILHAHAGLTENIKWNGPNYLFESKDRITMKIHPPKAIQLVFHRGAKTQVPPKDKLIIDDSGILVWKENDRAVATFKSRLDLETAKSQLKKIIHDWIEAAK